MGSLLKTLFGGLLGAFQSDTAQSLVQVALEKTEDVDKRNALVMQFLAMREETRRAELAKSTVPWVDALHKMGRQIFWTGLGVGVFVLILTGHGEELTRYAEFIYIVAGGGGAYTVLKGKGQ